VVNDRIADRLKIADSFRSQGLMLVVGDAVDQGADAGCIVLDVEIRRRQDRHFLAARLEQACQNADQVARVLRLGRDQDLVFEQLDELRGKWPAFQIVLPPALIFGRSDLFELQMFSQVDGDSRLDVAGRRVDAVLEQTTVTYYSTDDSGRHYQGTILGGSSGALLYDKPGRAFGIVIKHTPWSIDSLTDKSPEALYKEWNKRATISIFPLEGTLDTLKQHVPTSPFMGPLIGELQSNIAPDQIPVDLNQLATPLDMIRLIDEVVFGKIHEKWVTDYSAMGELSHRIQAAADELCTSTYYYKAWARLDMMQNDLLAKLLAERNLTLSVSKQEIKVIGDRPTYLNSRPRTAADKPPEEGALATPVINEGNKVIGDPPTFVNSRPGTAADKPPEEEGIIDQLGANTPDAAARLGVRFLDGALAVPQSDLAQSQVRLAVTLLRRAVAGPEIQRARALAMTNRDYAAIFANLALAEDLGIRFRVGTRDAAEKAILAAYALGGSPTAYQLGGRYASEDADPASAAGLYAQAFAMLSPRIRRERSIREEVVKDFRVAVAQAGGSPNTDIASFNVAMLPPKGSNIWAGAIAQNDLGRQTQALVVIETAANSICYNVAQRGGQPDTILNGAIDKVTDLNVKGSAQLTNDEYRGVLQAELSNTLKFTQDCKKSVFDTLVTKMLPTAFTDTGLSVSGIVHLRPRTGEKPSVDCNKPKEPIENLLCADADLAEWDGRLGQIYQRKLSGLSLNDQTVLRQRQRDWFKIRDATCNVPKTGNWNAGDLAPAKPCILQMMKQRVSELNN
jgi:uncharacterized protein YecT (DUF1311 family)